MILAHPRAYNYAVIIMSFKDRFICSVARIDALCEQSFCAKRRVFVFIVFVFVYFAMLGGVFSGDGASVYTVATFMFDTVCFIGVIISVYLSGCTVFAGAVCFAGIIPFAFVKGYQSTSLFVGLLPGVLPYFIFALYFAALLFIYCVATALSVSFSAYSACGIHEMLLLGRFRNYSFKFLLLISAAVGISYAMYNYLF